MKKVSQKVNKNNNPGVIKYINEDTNEIKKFMIILVGVAVMALLLYFVSAKYLIKDNFQDNTGESEISFDYTTIDVGNIFNRPYETYYVLAYDTTTTEAVYISALKGKYEKEDKLYTLDLSSDMNKSYLKESGNRYATTPSEIALIDPTLMKIVNGNITEYYEGIEQIESVIK